VLSLPFACWHVQQATARVTLPDGGEVAMTVRPMFGIHSDWTRSLEVRAGGRSARTELFADMGWWRGSKLYADPDGLYLLHEGQAGCLAFRTDPPRFVDLAREVCRGRGSPAGAFTYLGVFHERNAAEDGAWIGFATLQQRPERELPPPL
jgi:hypothetical protein